jgi:hypothetical protein
MHAVRSARPKLSLAVPVAAAAVAVGSKPVVPTLIIPAASSVSSSISASPLTPTARNTALNVRLASSSSSLQVPSSGLAVRPKKGKGKNVRFAEQESVNLVSPCPRDYYGDYAKMTREERRWSRSS